MTHEEIAELLGAWALDAVDPDEALIVARHLEVCPRCTQEVDGYREAAAALAFVGTTAPASLWERIEAQLEDEPAPDLDMSRFGARGTDAEPTRAPVEEQPRQGDVVSIDAARARDAGRAGGAVHGRGARDRRRTLGLRTAAVATVAAAAVVIGVLGVQVHHLDDKVARMTAAPSFGPGAGAVRVTLRSSDGLTLVPAVLAADGDGYVESGNLPALPAGKTYQLWAVASGKRISIGVLGNTFGVSTFTAHGKIDLLAITAEDAPGAATSSQAPVVVAPVPANRA